MGLHHLPKLLHIVIDGGDVSGIARPNRVPNRNRAVMGDIQSQMNLLGIGAVVAGVAELEKIFLVIIALKKIDVGS